MIGVRRCDIREFSGFIRYSCVIDRRRHRGGSGGWNGFAAKQRRRVFAERRVRGMGNTFRFRVGLRNGRRCGRFDCLRCSDFDRLLLCSGRYGRGLGKLRRRFVYEVRGFFRRLFLYPCGIRLRRLVAFGDLNRFGLWSRFRDRIGGNSRFVVRLIIFARGDRLLRFRLRL